MQLHVHDLGCQRTALQERNHTPRSASRRAEGRVACGSGLAYRAERKRREHHQHNTLRDPKRWLLECRSHRMQQGNLAERLGERRDAQCGMPRRQYVYPAHHRLRHSQGVQISF